MTASAARTLAWQAARYSVAELGGREVEADEDVLGPADPPVAVGVAVVVPAEAGAFAAVEEPELSRQTAIPIPRSIAATTRTETTVRPARGRARRGLTTFCFPRLADVLH